MSLRNLVPGCGNKVDFFLMSEAKYSVFSRRYEKNRVSQIELNGYCPHFRSVCNERPIKIIAEPPGHPLI